jgi:(R,R)-butanediol dehydrogenase/meso-butanediol dehydrogenase/diacetyl reductase
MLKEITIKATVTYEDQDFLAVVDYFCAGECSSSTLAYAIEFLLTVGTGKYQNLASMVTARIGLNEVVSGGFEQLIHSKDSHIKILVTPRSDLLARATVFR